MFNVALWLDPLPQDKVTDLDVAERAVATANRKLCRRYTYSECPALQTFGPSRKLIVPRGCSINGHSNPIIRYSCVLNIEFEFKFAHLGADSTLRELVQEIDALRARLVEFWDTMPVASLVGCPHQQIR